MNAHPRSHLQASLGLGFSAGTYLSTSFWKLHVEGRASQPGREGTCRGRDPGEGAWGIAEVRRFASATPGRFLLRWDGLKPLPSLGSEARAK